MTLPNATRRIALLLAAVMAVGLLAAGSAVAADHVQVLDGDDEDVIEDYEAADDQFIEYTFDAADADFGEDGTETVYFNISYDGTDHFEYNNDVDDGDESYTFNTSHEDFQTLPGGAGETTTVEMTAWGTDDDGDIATGPEVFDVDVEFNSTHATIYVDDPDDVEDEERTFWFDSFNAEFDEDVEIEGDDTDVNVFTDDEDIEDAVDLATEATDDGDRVALLMATTLDGDLTYVFDGEPGETITGDDVNDTDHSYIVIEDDDEATIHVGEDDDTDELDVSMVANERPGFGDLRDDLDYGLFEATAGAFGLGIPLLALSGVAVVSIRRRETEEA